MSEWLHFSMMIKTVTGNIRYIRNAFHESRGYTILIVFLNMLVSCMLAQKVLAVGKFIDDVEVFQKLGFRHIAADAGFVIVVYLLEYVFTSIQSYLNYRFTIRLNNCMEDQFYSKLSRVKYAVLENNDTNDLIYQVKDGIGKKFAEGFSKILDLVGLVVKIGSIFYVIITKNVWTGLLLLVVFGFLIPLYRKIGENNYEAYAEANKVFRWARSYRMIVSDREYANEREVFGYFPFFNNKWTEKYQSAIEKQLKATKQNHLKILVITAAIAALTTLLSCAMLPALFGGSISLGVYIVLVTQLYDVIHFMSWNFSYIIDDLAENQLYLDDFDAFMKLDEVLESGMNETLAKDNIEIRIENLSFQYPGCKEYALKNFSFIFKAGKHYAIVGKNGAGKTTLVKLLLGLYDEYEGKIFINGTDIRDLSQDEIHNVFSTVFQDYAKYALSVKENILLDKIKYPEKEQQAENILKQLGIWEEIQHLKDGMNTSLGKVDHDSVDLSGGGWQKIAIARGAVLDAGIYILDEPSSALDPISERSLYEIYNRIFKNHTTILITHRLGNTKDQDEILVLDSGQLIEHGHHTTLMEQKSMYYNMFSRQRSWYYEKAV